MNTQRASSADTDEENPCLECGACCAHFRVSFYCGELLGGLGSPSGETGTELCSGVPPELTTKLNDVMACMKGTESGNGRCIALAGEPGHAGIRCTIYPLRPSPCREFESRLEDGTPNPDCQRLRATIGLPPLIAKMPSER